MTHQLLCEKTLHAGTRSIVDSDAKDMPFWHGLNVASVGLRCGCSVEAFTGGSAALLVAEVPNVSVARAAVSAEVERGGRRRQVGTS